MAQSIKLGSDTYLDWSGVTVDSNGTKLSDMEAGDVTWNSTNVTGDQTRKRWFKRGNIVIASLEFTPVSGKIANANEICSGLPAPKYDSYMGFFDCGNGKQVRVNSGGYLQWYFPTNTNDLSRIDVTLVYFV